MPFARAAALWLALFAAPAAAQNVSIGTDLSGTLYFNEARPMKQNAVMALDLGTGRYRIIADGADPVVRNGTIAHVAYCSPLQIQLSITDSGGFVMPVSDCFEAETIGPDLEHPALSPDGSTIAITNHVLIDPNDTSLLKRPYMATQIYTQDGTVLAEFRDFGPAVWTANGSLLLAGRGGDAGYGIFKADIATGRTERIDDGRLRSDVAIMDAHPSEERIAFVFNGTIFEMDLASGAPKRRHAHGALLSGLTYAPDGQKLAFISSDTIDEAVALGGSGYPIHVLDGDRVHMVRLPFPVLGPLDWAD